MNMPAVNASSVDIIVRTTRVAALIASSFGAIRVHTPFTLERICDGSTQLWPGDQCFDEHSGAVRCVFSMVECHREPSESDLDVLFGEVYVRFPQSFGCRELTLALSASA